MYSIALRDFRGFHSQDFVDIRPLTLLVGENSAGKSSFLAGLKFLLDFASGEEEPSFNKDPFQLGTFQQISHYRSGRGGRAREFGLSLKQNVREFRRRRRTVPATEVEFEITFISSESHASISVINVKTPYGSLRARIETDGIRIEHLTKDQRIIPIQDRDRLPRIARTDFARYWPLLLRDLNFRILRQQALEEERLLDEGFDESTALIAEIAMAASDQMSGDVNATAAIRTKPLRTYTPGTETQDGEGSHVPFEIAKIFRARNKEPWLRLKRSIEDFGASSEMFREINVKSFGSSASDPFQIQFSIDGPKMNITDLGYGTSQVLPILYSTSTGASGSTHLIQQPEAHMHPRAQASLGEFFVKSYTAENKRFILETHSDFIVDRIRNAVFNGNLSGEDVSILFFEKRRLETTVTPIKLDKAGEPVNLPSTYREFFLGEQLRILGVK